MWRYLVPMGLLVIVVVFFYRGLFLDASHIPSPLVGEPAPTFDVPQLQQPDARLTREDLVQGEPVLVNVWGSWCPGCWVEHDKLMEIAESGVIQIYGINWKDNNQAALNWLDRLGDPYVATGVDADGRVAIDWGVYGAPETFLLDSQGYVRYAHRGEMTDRVWEERFLPLIRDMER